MFPGDAHSVSQCVAVMLGVVACRASRVLVVSLVVSLLGTWPRFESCLQCDGLCW